MFRLNLKIAFRNLWKNKGITAINVGGLSTALASFILVMLYVNFETSYDADNKNYDHIYKLGRVLPESKTYYTSPPLAKSVREQIEEVERIGNTKSLMLEFPLNSEKGRVYSNDMLMMDYDVALMFNIQADGGLQQPIGPFPEMYLPRNTVKELFEEKNAGVGRMVTIGPRTAGQSQMIKGTIERNNNHSNITFDLLTVGNNIGFSDGYGRNSYNTWLQVKPNTDIDALTKKIDALYRKEALAAGSLSAEEAKAKTLIFLDPLKDIHLRPSAGSDANYKIVVVLSVLSFIILIIACINFTNLSIAQANGRAKEVGVKKVMGAYYRHLVFQFLTEIFIQCAIALILGLVIAELAMPMFNNLISGSLSLSQSGSSMLINLAAILISITLIAGLYPALILSGFKPAYVLKGDLQTSNKTLWLRNGLLVGQFSFAVVFIIGLFIVSGQLNFMRTEDRGFSPNQVVSIRNIAVFSDPEKFDVVRQRIMKVPGVQSVTASSNIPDGSKSSESDYIFNGKKESIEFIDVDFDYFETLGIKLKEGRFFSSKFNADTAISAVVNESLVNKYTMVDPVGQTIKGCNIDYRIVGVIKDYKTRGFEYANAPTIYTMKNPCGNFRIKLMVKVEKEKMASVLATLKANWKDINTLDGEDFRVDFLDEVYGNLFVKQQQMKSVFLIASILTILIAVLGLFAFSAYQTNNRIREISIRKVLGASNLQILKLLNIGFVKVVLLANLIAFPIAYLFAKEWLDTFVYRIDISFIPFLSAAAISIFITLFTVSLQAGKAVNANPADALKCN
ncbi:MAG: ABC transporter permease [Pedobacter sp.]|nr:MAG: ABC transporter permease [Pedobacter sp.]